MLTLSLGRRWVGFKTIKAIIIQIGLSQDL